MECGPVHLRHAEIAEDQIVDMGADSVERLPPIGNRVDLAESIAPYQAGHEFTQNRIIVNHEHPGTLKTSHMDITVRPSIARFAISKSLVADGTTAATVGRHRATLGRA
jgi:hypothetical protein